MKYRASFFILFTVLFQAVRSQTIAYSKETIPFRETDHAIIIGSFGDTLHVVKEEAWGNKELLLYGPGMELADRKTLQQEPEGFGDVQVIPYADFYYLLLTGDPAGKLKILKIDVSGEFADITKQFEQQLALRFADSSLRGSFRKVNDRIFFIANRYDKVKEKMFLSVLGFDSLFRCNDQHLLITDVDSKADIINDIVFKDTSVVYIMKSFRKGFGRYGEIEIVQYDLNTGSNKRMVFSNSEDIFYEPRLRYRYSDSALLFFSMIRNKSAEELYDADFKCYYVKLDNELKETSSSLTVNLTPRGRERIMLITQDHRLSVLDNIEFLYNMYPDFSPMPFERVFYHGEGPPVRRPSAYGYSLEQKPDVLWVGPRTNTNRKRVDFDMRVIWLDHHSGEKTVLLKSKKGKMKSEFFNYFLLSNEDQMTLLYTTGFSLFRNGISYLFLNKGNASEEEFLRVNERYDYLLTSAKQIGMGSMALPYVYKGRLGMIKVSF